jgi:hypothetical protein
MFGLLRTLLYAALIAWTGYGLLSGWHRTSEIVALHSSGKRVNAQVIGCEQMGRGERMGFVHYAFNAGSRSIDNRFAVPVSMYGNYHIGQIVPVTYLPEEPHTVRIGAVDLGTVLRSVVVAVVFLVTGLIAFGLPLLAIGASQSATQPAVKSS